MRRFAVVVFGLGLVLLPLAGVRADGGARGGGGRAEVRDARAVYYGDVREFARPSVVNAAAVFGRIPEYQEIARRRLGRNEPESGILVEKANLRFVRAVAPAARAAGRVLVAEVGAVVIVGEDGDGARAVRPGEVALPDLTAEAARRAAE
ncbi:MAG: hypothetical protein HZA54_12605 [Planctomycetes bacterium]|nr:hypothetical protein [Planctomycetota bacterium]